MAARELRYGYFEQLRKAIDAEAILVAHHKNDAVETLLMNLIRGTGIHGLQGIKPRNGRIIRPLLCVSRKEIVEWLQEIGQDYVTDSTNLEDDVTRNKLRLNIIPLLEQINPAASENIAQTALRMVEAGKVFDTAMNEIISDVTAGSTDDFVVIDKEKLNAASSKEYTLHTILSPYHFSPSQIEEIALSDYIQSGKTWESSTHQLVVDRKALLLRQKTVEGRRPFRIPETGTYVIYETKDRTECISIKSVVVDDVFKISKERDTVTLDADKVRFPLTIRRVETGDRFIPFGMKGSKLISDYLTDRKKNAFEKQNQLVMLDADGNVLWLIGERPDARCCITSGTINALVVRYY
jgi:tRNA(Ile)-lysidine synthase